MRTYTHASVFETQTSRGSPTVNVVAWAMHNGAEEKCLFQDPRPLFSGCQESHLITDSSSPTLHL